MKKNNRDYDYMQRKRRQERKAERHQQAVTDGKRISREMDEFRRAYNVAQADRTRIRILAAHLGLVGLL